MLQTKYRANQRNVTLRLECDEKFVTSLEVRLSPQPMVCSAGGGDLGLGAAVFQFFCFAEIKYRQFQGECV